MALAGQVAASARGGPTRPVPEARPIRCRPDAVGRVRLHPSPHVILHHQPAGPSQPKPCRPATTVSPARCAVLTNMAAWPYLFAGIPVSDYAAALAWYERLLGSPPSFFPTTRRPCGNSPNTGRCSSSSSRDMPATPCTPSSWMTSTPWWPRSLSWDWRPAKRETYSDGVRKITYIDRDGNEIGFGGLPR